MFILIAFTFILGYVLIALEHTVKIDKAASALITGVLCWVIVIIGRDSLMGPGTEAALIDEAVLHHVGEIAQILFFLLAAMTIVEIIDTHDGFDVITSRITTSNKAVLLWIVGLTTFFLSAVLDNLTTAIVMAALLKKILHKKEDLWFFAGIVVVAANAGGAWSPIGDVTTIMLWIGGQVTASKIITSLFLPSVICLVLPLAIASQLHQGQIDRFAKTTETSPHAVLLGESKLVLAMGIAGLLFVPIFKNITHLPPFMGMLLSLAVLWIFTEILHKNKDTNVKSHLSINAIIRKVDTTSVLFFLGILLAVAGLQTAGHLSKLAEAMDATFGNIFVINILIGLLSSIVDNVPLVAGAMGMYPMTTYPTDHTFWELLAYCAGTGGSALVIGSAAGVAIMGILKIEFMWYLKKISWLALIGYFAGVLMYYVFS